MQKVTTLLDYKYIGSFKKPEDCRKYSQEIKGCCGQSAIASILGIGVADVFKAWNVKEENFRNCTSQKEMKQILLLFGYKSKQRSVKDKLTFPKCDLAIIRVSFGDRNQHWMEISKRSHYLGLKKMPSGVRYVFDSFQNFDNKPTNGLWVEHSEYKKVMHNEKMFITSYLELTPTEVKCRHSSHE